MIASRSYPVACRDGEEARLRDVAALVDAKANAATGALGRMSEARTLLFASLMLADGLVDAPAPAAILPAEPAFDPILADALEQLASRIEALAATLEGDPAPAFEDARLEDAHLEDVTPNA